MSGSFQTSSAPHVDFQRSAICLHWRTVPGRSAGILADLSQPTRSVMTHLQDLDAPLGRGTTQCLVTLRGVPVPRAVRRTDRPPPSRSRDMPMPLRCSTSSNPSRVDRVPNQPRHGRIDGKERVAASREGGQSGNPEFLRGFGEDDFVVAGLEIQFDLHAPLRCAAYSFPNRPVARDNRRPGIPALEPPRRSGQPIQASRACPAR